MAMSQSKSNKQQETDGINLVQNILKSGTPNALLALAHVQGAMINSMAEYNLETSKFFQRRMLKDIELASKMAKCSTVTELQDATAEFYKSAFEDYSEEASTLANLYTGLTAKAISSVQNEAIEAGNVIN